MMMRRQWHLRTSLIVLLTIIFSVSFLVVGGVLFLVRLPQITEETRADLSIEAADLASRSEVVLGALQTQLDLIAVTLRQTSGKVQQDILDRAVGNNSAFTAIYQLDENGVVLRAAVSSALAASRRIELINNDLSQDQLYQRVQHEHGPVWSDKYLSPVSSTVAVGIGIPAGKATIIGEIPLDYILESLRVASGQRSMMLWIIDRTGEILADSEDASRVGVVNLGSQALLKHGHHEGTPSARLTFEGKEFEAAAAYSKELNWHFLTRTPANFDNPRIGSTLDLGVATVGGSILLSILLATLWATGLARPINAITQRARQIASNQTPESWPKGRIIELNELSTDLERMATTLQEREQELETIFNASPVGIAVLDPGQSHAFTRVNDGTLHMLRAQRDELLGRTGRDLKLWCDPDKRRAFYSRLEQEQSAECETWIRRIDGSEFLAAISVRNFDSAGQLRTILVARDVTELRRIENEIRTLNAELEVRVSQRTEELNRVNTDLSTTVERLQETQDELVRSEKLASLGTLVAGVAHELNTPLGNALMAVTTLNRKLKLFHEESTQGIKRSSLDQLLAAADTGADIAFRNLTRASELVTSFKQVAADQTSSQRRQFLLDEVIDEILLTIHPLLKHSQVEVKVRVDKDLHFDSYPGPLGQVITNLISNAVTHAFPEGFPSPCIDLLAIPENETTVRLQVSDNGCGIPPDLLPRVFDPFVTSRMGSGGTGLGLHIAHNLVAQTLGGNISVHSEVDVGTAFTLILPRVAPATVAEPKNP